MEVEVEVVELEVEVEVEVVELVVKVVVEVVVVGGRGARGDEPAL